MTILGSIHVGNRNMYPFSRPIRSALEAADVLVFECDTQSDAALQLTAEKMRLPEGVYLESLVDAGCFKKLERTAQKLGYAMETLNTLHPWAVVSMLSVASTADSMNASSRLGVENRVRSTAPIREEIWLETTLEQLEMLNGMSPALQEYLLESACDEVLAGTENADTASWPQWWREGNADAFASSYRAGMAEEKDAALAAEYHDQLITQRNIRMAKRLTELLESDEKQNCFVTVGLMHLVLEEDSVLTELEKQGYTVEKIIP